MFFSIVTTTSVWLVVGPALIAGGIGLVSALLSYRSSQASLSRGAEDSRRDRAHQREMLILDRRMRAIESIWQRLFSIEQSGELGDQFEGEIVRAVVWLPEDIGQEVLSAILGFRSGVDQTGNLESIRQRLQNLTKTKEGQI